MESDVKGTLIPLLVIVAVASGCRPSPSYTEPPADSYTTETYQVKIGEAVEPLQGAAVTQGFFQSAGARPMQGRFFVDADAGSPTRVVVLSHTLWTERFASSPETIGRTIELDGHRATVVGIAPSGFRFPEGTLLWTQKNARIPPRRS